MPICRYDSYSLHISVMYKYGYTQTAVVMHVVWPIADALLYLAHPSALSLGGVRVYASGFI